MLVIDPSYRSAPSSQSSHLPGCRQPTEPVDRWCQDVYIGWLCMKSASDWAKMFSDSSHSKRFKHLTQHLAPPSEACLQLQPEDSYGRLVWQAREGNSRSNSVYSGLSPVPTCLAPGWYRGPHSVPLGFLKSEIGSVCYGAPSQYVGLLDGLHPILIARLPPNSYCRAGRGCGHWMLLSTI